MDGSSAARYPARVHAGSGPSPCEPQAAFSDFSRLAELQRLVQRCSASRAPRLEALLPDRLREATRLAVLAGSFNPLTDAHLALAEAAERQGLGSVVFALATRTVDKEQIEGAMLADRLLVLELYARRTERRAVVLLNRGLYVDQATLLRAAFRRVDELTFLVGFDKIVQIFDPRYYQDRDAALDALFALASIAVAPRSDAGRSELDRLLDRAENRRYAPRVRFLKVDSSVAWLASSDLRAALEQGRGLPAGLPPESVAFIRATGCYAPGPLDDRYARRCALIERLANPAGPATLCDAES